MAMGTVDDWNHRLGAYTWIERLTEFGVLSIQEEPVCQTLGYLGDLNTQPSDDSKVMINELRFILPSF